MVNNSSAPVFDAFLSAERIPFPLFLFVSLQLFLMQNLHRTLEGWVGGLETAPLRAIPLALWKRMENEEGEARPEKAALPQEAGMSHAQSSRRVFAGSCCWDEGSCCTCSASDVNPSFSLNFSSEHCRAPSRGAPGGHVQSHQGVACPEPGMLRPFSPLCAAPQPLLGKHQIPGSGTAGKPETKMF